MDWFRGLAPAVQAAVVAGAVAVATAIVAAINTTLNTWLKDRLERRLAAARRREAELETYRRYAEPLTSAAASLYWRLREIFETGGGYYLHAGGGATPFEAYKTTSTRYRLAALLGWITALKRELLLSDASTDSSVVLLRDAVRRVESSLAEGGHVERDRAIVVCELLGVDVTDISDIAKLGRDINAALKRSLYAAGQGSALDLPDSDADHLSSAVIDLVAAQRATQPHNVQLAGDARQMIQVLAVREAWIYRDWQDAIGELMLDEPKGTTRRFDVKGYRGFMLLGDTVIGPDRLWMDRLTETTTDFDVGRDPRLDARVEQLRGVFIAVARLLREFNSVEPARSSLEDAAADAVRKTLVAANVTP